MGQREIKFRYWSGSSERMLTMEEFQIARAIELNNQGKGALMQYTGLKDKNGTEIYEGDILSARPIGANYPIPYVVLFNEDAAFRMRFIDRYINNESHFYDEKLDSSKYNIFEIIGNIHQNPELLKP